MSKGECLQRSISKVDINWMVQPGFPSMPKGEIVDIDDVGVFLQ